MSLRTLKPAPLTAERFAPYGEVIERLPAARQAMNEARFERFADLARVDAGAGGRVQLSIARARTKTPLPFRFDLLERHPRGSQAFVPLDGREFVVVVGPAGESLDSDALEAFVSNGRQGVNYRRGTWHLPMIGLYEGQEFLVVDRFGSDNCEELVLDEPVVLERP